jgi:arginyl-tRNA synthetase
MTMISDTLKEAVAGALLAIGLPKGETGDFAVEHPDELSHGDYSTNAALIFSKELKINPRELAEKLVVELEKEKPDEIERIDIAGPGFINFHLKRTFFVEQVGKILKEEDKFGSSKIGKGKKVLVEYSSPNIAKPFTVGHLRSTIIGDSIAHILTFSGYKVIRDNHLGDWGTQFGKLVVALKKWGSLDADGKIKDVKNLVSSRDKMKYLVDLYIKFNSEAEKTPELDDSARAAFVDLERGNKGALALYEQAIDISREYFKDIYERLNVSAFDTEHGEHFYEPYIPKAMKVLEKENLLKESEGAKLVFFDNEKHPPLMIIKSDGATLYAVRDLATDLWRRDEYGKGVTIVNEVGMEQTLYFKQLFEVEEILGWFKKGQRIHVAHGHYRFKDGKMSTRKGNVIWLEDIMDEAEKRAGEINQETAHVVGIGAIKFNDLKRESLQDIAFDWDEALNLRGDSCPYLQYSYARAKSILEKAKKEGIKLDPNLKLDQRFKTNNESYPLEKILYRFSEVVLRSATEYKPHYIATYLLDLAGAFNNFYGSNQIVNKEDAQSPYRIALTKAFAVAVKNGLTLLGIETPEKM